MRTKDKLPGQNRIPVYVTEQLDYEAELHKLQIELVKLQNYVKDTNMRVLVIFEGGRSRQGRHHQTHHRTHVNARGVRVVALAKPSDTEKTQWYFQRYVAHLPSGGEICLTAAGTTAPWSSRSWASVPTSSTSAS
ncbi:MAG: hypothetical protein R3E95_18010 [Thiolinea sp.]